jgi:hypothetical protein
MRRSIRKRIRRVGDGVDLMADINAEIAINVGRKTVPADPKRSAKRDPAEPPTGGTAADERHSQGNDPEGEVR